MQKLLYADLGGATLADSLASAGSNYSWPTLIQGAKLKLGFRLVEEVEGEFVEAEREITSIRVKIGELYAQPESGTFRLWVGPEDVEAVENVNLTAEIPVTADAPAVGAALNALALVGPGEAALYGAATATKDDGSWFVVFAGEEGPVPIRGVNVRTDVISFVRIWASEQDGVWTHEIRPDKAGLAFADQSTQELPPPPVVTTFRPGYEAGEGEFGINEIQKIQFNPRFRGIYEVRWKGRKSSLLSRDDGPDQFGGAIAPLADADGEFVVTNPSSNVGMVEFAGSMGAQPQDDLEIAVVDSPPGDHYVILDLGKKTTADILRQMELDDADEVTMPIEVEIRYKDPTDPATILVWPWQQPVTVRRRLIREGEALVNDHDLMRPHDPRTYRPFNASQWAVGNHFYPFELVDGGTEHVVDHNLHTLLVEVFLRENAPGGRFLVKGTDYTASYDPEGDGEDSVLIELLGDYAEGPPPGGLIGCIVGLNHTAAFQSGVTWEMGQINGLLDVLSLIEGRLDALEAGNFPGSPPALAAISGKIERALPRVWRIPRARTLPEDPGTLQGWNPFAPGSPLRDIRLLPAVHLSPSGLEALPSPLPAAAAGFRGRVFEALEDRPDFPGGGLASGDHAACDGRDWYRVRRESEGETTWYPSLFEVELFRFSVSPDELALRTRMELNFGFEAVLHDPTRRPGERRTVARMSLLIERGVRLAATSPATPGSNIDVHFADAVVLARHDFDVTAVPTAKRFGLSVARAGNGDLSATASKLLASPVPVPAPETADFALRARIARFDVEGLPEDSRGVFGLRGLDIGLGGKPEATLGLWTIS